MTLDLPPLWVPVGLAIVGLLLLFAAIYAALARRNTGRYGRLRSVDLPTRPGTHLRSERWRLSGRPDEIRERADGVWIPIEVKSRRGPRGSPPASHQAQVLAYCLLIEETTGRAPPYGVLRYSDGAEFHVVWDERARAWISSLRASMDRPYRGEATPSVGRCRGCPWRTACDRSAV
jgi:CRISPR-associated exonuclease Cas4